MANWFKHLRRFKTTTLPQSLAILLLLVGLPMIGSRSLGGNVVRPGNVDEGSVVPLDLDTTTRLGDNSANKPNQFNSNSELVGVEDDDDDDEDDDQGESVEKSDTVINQFSSLSSASGSSSSSGSPCALLVSNTAEKVVSYEEKSLLAVSHHAFDVSHGIVPNVLYTVDVEVPGGSLFRLDYWGNDVSDGERSRVVGKRRHQRDRDVLELFFNDPSSSTRNAPDDPDSVAFCSKHSLGGANKEGQKPLILSFSWYISGNGVVSPLPTSGPPPTIVFRLRFTPIAESVSSIFEQTLHVAVRRDCFLVMKIGGRTTLSMDSLWNAHPSVKTEGLNCTVLLLPRPTFGLEVRITNLSIYGMRDICKGRYLTFSRTMQTSKSNSDYSDSSSAPELQNEFPTYTHQLSPLGRKFCGKLQDYSAEERLLTFKAGGGGGETQSQSIPVAVQPQNKLGESPPYSFSNPHGESTKNGSDAGGDGDMNPNVNENNDNVLKTSSDGLLLRVSLPGSVKNKETFTLDINSLSPCQRVVLRDLNGGLRYSKGPTLEDSSDQDANECSIVIHVPYGNRIITRMSLTKRPVLPDDDEIDQEESEPVDGKSESDAEFAPNKNPNNLNNSFYYKQQIYNNINNNNNASAGDSDGSSFSKLMRTTKSYECPPNFAPSSTTSPNHPMFMLIRAEDIESGSEFEWCFDGSSDSSAQHKRAWKSSGNKVKISFELKYFSVFHLTYQSVPIEELVGNCDPGWVALNPGRCAILVESGSNWPAAEESCQMKGGHLATIEDDDVGHKFQKIITESALFHPRRAYWIGANDRESEGNFQWTSGLPFSYKNWFVGWAQRRHEISNAQPNDDGWSGQDCVEIRQVLNPSTPYSEKPLSSQFWSTISLATKSKGQTQSNHQNQVHTANFWPQSRFFWNDRNCEAKNFYICEKLTHKDYDEKDYSCNKTLELSPGTVLTLTSPAYPMSYPDNIVCLTTIAAVAGYRIVLSFDEFVLEESPSCGYDSLEIKEILHEPIDQNNKTKNLSQLDTSILSKRVCGDWTKRLKLLRYKTTSSTSSLSLRLESDFSHHFAGFKANVWTEKDVSGQCSDQQMKKFKSHCYLTTSSPAVSWANAQQICTALQGKLASVVSTEEWKFLAQSLPATSRFDKNKSTFWIGGMIDRSSQLVWSDRMPFNFSAFHSSDLQTISDWKCLSIYWHEWGRGDFAWRLADCNQLSGYVCKKKSYDEGETIQAVNKTFSGTGGKLPSPNFPSNYQNNLDYGYHLIAPPGTQIVLRFSHLDVEDQEDCLYDYVEIVDKKTANATRYCGTYSTADLERLDYVSSSNELDVFFHADFSHSGTGFEIAWRAVDVAMGQRIWLSFQIFELGHLNAASDTSCHLQDHVVVDLDGGVREDGDSSADNEIILCGNLTAFSYRTSFMSIREKIKINVVSPIGKSGRGFLGRFKAVPGQLEETLNVATPANSSVSLTSINFPLIPPENTNITLALSSPPNYVLTLNINGTSSCSKTAKSYLEIRDPYHGTNGTTWKLCQSVQVATLSSTIVPKSSGRMRDGLNLVKTISPVTTTSNENGDSNVNNKVGYKEISQGITQMNTAISFRSTFNRLDVRQVYSPGFRGRMWSARIVTMLDENFRAKVLADGDRLLKLDGCMNNPCANGGSCISENGKHHICRCTAPFTGPFCGLSLCDLNPCLFGDCILGEKSIKCVCQLGYGGERCDRRMKPCDDNPCSGHGSCVETNKTAYKCMCYAWWEGPQCESRMLVIPFKPLSQRVFEEPFWLGLLTVTGVLGVIGLIWCLKRHFPEKLEKLLNEDLDKNRGISWGTSQQQAVSPPASRSFLGRIGIRKPSLLSLSSATSNVSGTGASPHSYENRTFSLDDLLRPSRSMMRTPSPHRRRNYSVQVRRDPAEKQLILQQLVSGGGSSSLDGESKPAPTPKPTLAEIIQMSERRLRLASASSMQSEAGSVSGGGEPCTSRQAGADEEETSFSTQAAIKAEKKVTFARMLDKLAASGITSSSSGSDLSCTEETKMVVVAPKPQSKKDRKGHFRRSNKAYNRGRNSETDQDYMDISSSDTTPDPIYIPKLPTRLCISPTGASNSAGGSSNALGKPSQKIPKIASADSLLALFKRFSGSNSAPPSPQYSENEESSAGATPLSTPSSPRNSLLSIRPPALMITSVPEPNNTIELPVIDPFAQNQGCWRAPPASSITLEVPMRDYCLSPIHEVPTPLGTPSHSPCHTPMMKRMSADENLPSIKILMSSEDDDTTRSSSSKKDSPPPRMLRIPIISISVDDAAEDGGTEIDTLNMIEGDPDGNNREEEKKAQSKLFYNSLTGESEVIPDVLIHVPPERCSESQPDLESPVRDVETPLTSPRVKTRPPPLIFANEILSCSNKGPGDDDRNVKIVVPFVNIEYATPVAEYLPKFPSIITGGPKMDCEEEDASHHSLCKTLPEMIPSIIFEHSAKENPLVPPTITINQSSEAESSSDDTPAQRHMLLRPNLCFLSPFAGTSDRIPSESNLSTSGYSSMASPCPSRCPSVSPLCPSEAEDYHTCSHLHGAQRRASLTPGTPKKLLIAPLRRSSFNAPHHATSGLLCDNSNMLCEHEGPGLGERRGEMVVVEVETDSAVEVETDVESCAIITLSSEVDNPAMSMNTDQQPGILSEDMKRNDEMNTLLQVPKKGMPKSRSLDIGGSNASAVDQYSPSDPNSIPDGRNLDKKGQLLRGLGPSLDSKLNNVDRGFLSTTGVTIIFPLSNSISNLSGRKNCGNLIEIPEEKERRLSPASSRSESPLSELSATGGFSFLGSPLTDSDGVYDCGSSEVLTNNNETDTQAITSGTRLGLIPLSRSNPPRRSAGKRKERKPTRGGNNTLLSANPASSADTTSDKGATGGDSQDPILSGDGELQVDFRQISHLHLPPYLAKALPSSSVSPKRASPKRRIRAQPNMDNASSSSSESLASIRSRPRSRTSWSSVQNSRNTSRNNSPLPIFQDQDSNQPSSPSVFLPCAGSLEESSSIKSSMDKEELKPEPRASALSRGGSSELTSRTLTPPIRKISRLRTISHQIRFLRRLELSLIRKKECLTHVKKSSDRRTSILSHSDSESSRCDSSESYSSSSSTCSCSSCSECGGGRGKGGQNEDEEDDEDDDDRTMGEKKPLLLAPSSSGGGSSGKKRQGKVTPLNFLENISAQDFLDSSKKRIRKYK
ncbi:Protocadherin Fat 1 [Folsomia candida]|uniref:Protocadherin Fat 1 n=1 Tax=Folsomia candida TaxID=158441 RepID=A0A226EXB4_FOLCA|nr:Protocadherin Fat 1 [Folsomia candida]